MSETLSPYADTIVSYLLVASVIAAALTPLAWLVIKLARIRAAVSRSMVWTHCLIGTAATDYAKLLTDLADAARPRPHLQGAALVEGRLLGRVRQLLDPRRTTITRPARMTALAVTLAALLCFAVVGSVRLAPTEAPSVPFYDIAEVHEKNGQWKLARAAWFKAKHNLGHPSARREVGRKAYCEYRIGMTYEREGQLALAIAHVQNALRTPASEIDIYMGRNGAKGMQEDLDDLRAAKSIVEHDRPPATTQRVAPPPVRAPSERFAQLYRLDDGQVLKHIAPPLIPERKEYYRNEEASQAEAIPEAPDRFVFHWDRKLKKGGLTFGKTDFDSVLRHVLGLASFEYSGPDELLKLDLPGDWIVRNDSPQKAKLRTLEAISKTDLGRSIRFEKHTVEREVIVAKGHFNFRPPSGTYNDDHVHFFSDKLDANEGAGGGTAESIGKLYSLTSRPMSIITSSTMS